MFTAFLVVGGGILLTNVGFLGYVYFNGNPFQ